MSPLYDALVVLHLVGWAIVLGGHIATVRQPGIYKGTLHGALTALVTGLALFLLAETADSLDKDLSVAKMTIKIVLACAVTALAYIGQKKGDEVSPGIKHAIGGVTLVTVIVAVFM
jgi:hypothetical protein